VGVNATVAVALAKDFQDGEWVFPGLQGGIYSMLPMLVSGFGPLKSDSVFIFFFNSSEVSADYTGLRSWNSFRGKVCGKLVLNKAKNSSSVSSPERDATSAMRLIAPDM
jgi:hypothetical protein